MVQITSDTSSMLTPQTGPAMGVAIAPLHVTIAGRTYRDMDEIFPPEFLRIIAEGNLPTSSQPSPADMEALFEKATAKSPVLHITMADGLSGAYAAACALRETMPNKAHITVLNSATLCGPHAMIVRKAQRLAQAGLSVEEILEGIRPNVESAKSFLIPQDFDYLRRGGRLSPAAAKVGTLLGLVPLMTQGDGGRRLEKAGLCRNFTKAVEKCIEGFRRIGVNADYIISVSHADTFEQGRKAYAMLSDAFPGAAMELLDLTPAFITQGGPKCVAIQTCRRV